MNATLRPSDTTGAGTDSSPMESPALARQNVQAPVSTAPLPHRQRDVDSNQPFAASTGARIRIHSGALRGLDGTVLLQRGNDRLLIDLPSLCDGVCAEVDARVVEFLDESKS